MCHDSCCSLNFTIHIWNPIARFKQTILSHEETWSVSSKRKKIAELFRGEMVQKDRGYNEWDKRVDDGE